jgi:hypothetical protein
VSDYAPTSVYRYYDSDGALVYVGITARGVQRQNEHNALAEWWRYVARQDVEHYLTREAAAAREIELIARFRPPFNRQYNPDHERLRDDYLDSRSEIEGAAVARGRRIEAEEFLAFIDAASESTDPLVAEVAAEILRLGGWLADHVRDRSDDDLTQRRADMLSRHFASGYRRAEVRA